MAVLRRLVLIVVFGLLGGALALPTLTHADEGRTYVVATGDTLIDIASKSGVRLSDLLRVNDLRLSSLILPGQRLDLPASSSGSPTPSTHAANPSSTVQSGSTVLRGDNLTWIARRNGVSLSALLAVNRFSVSSLIVPGMTLKLPSRASTPARSSSTPTSSGESSATYVVRLGDTLSGIATRNRVSLTSLLVVNKMSVTSLILPGMRLSLPAGSNAPGAGAVPASAQPSAATGVAAVVNYALAQVGKPYRFFSKGPDSFDCSGLTLAAYKQAGVTLVHQSAWQARQGTAVDFLTEPIRPGDLVFLARRGSETINHVGLAVTSRTWIQARGTGHPVKVGPIPSENTIVAVRRYVTAS
ncbi:MAG: LysM repeat protein [Ilumatobacter sp.]|jgi:LysM repeat protein